MKVIAFYLPQYHRIPENDEWWGEGFTEWTNLKKAKPLFEGHNQPRIPLDNHYYNLLDPKELDWQAKLAKKYGIYGFCIYHYWFNGHMLLQKPVELLLKTKSIDTHYCICWANESWTNAWVSSSDKFLIKQSQGDRAEWVRHFNYLLPYFKDPRYIKIDGKPFFVIYRPELFSNMSDMIDLWNQMAIDNGFKGMKFAYQVIETHLKSEDSFDYRIEYEPVYANYDLNHNKHKLLKSIKHVLVKIARPFNINLEYVHPEGLVKRNYDQTWEAIIKRKPADKKALPGAFVDWDNTPRKQNRGSVMVGYDVNKFEYYLEKQILHAKRDYHKNCIFIFAWNEWTEGGYLEPDDSDGYKRLESVYKALQNTGELEENNHRE